MDKEDQRSDDLNDLIDISNHYEAMEESRIMMQEQSVLNELNRIMDEAIAA